MKVLYNEEEFEIPDFVVENYIQQFEGLAGRGDRTPILELRTLTEDTIDMVCEDPDILYEAEYLAEFVNAIAIREALRYHGVLYDA